MDKCRNQHDPITYDTLEEPVVRFQVSVSDELFNCYGKDTLKRWIDAQIARGIDPSKVRDPLSGVNFGIDFIKENYPEYYAGVTTDEDISNVSFEIIQSKIERLRELIIQNIPTDTLVEQIVKYVEISDLSYSEYESLKEYALETAYNYDYELIDETTGEPIVNAINEKMAGMERIESPIEEEPAPVVAPQRRTFVQSLRRFMGIGGKKTRRRRRSYKKKSSRKIKKTRKHKRRSLSKRK